MAAVSHEQAEKLTTDLTPFGATRAGNTAGTIPEWTGGMTTPSSEYKGEGTPRIDPFADEEPEFIIDASNYQQYTDNLSEGQRIGRNTRPT